MSNSKRQLKYYGERLVPPAGKRSTDPGKIQDENNPALLRNLHFNNAVNILFVEDNVFNQELGAYVLNKIGCYTEIANSGAEAIELIRRNKFHLVLMDINMPGLDGYETTRIMREQLLLDIPIIAFTTNTLEEDVQKSLRSGMNDHLGKPYTELQLAWIIRKWTQRSGNISS